MLAICSIGIANILVLTRVVTLWDGNMVCLCKLSGVIKIRGITIDSGETDVVRIYRKLLCHIHLDGSDVFQAIR